MLPIFIGFVSLFYVCFVFVAIISISCCRYRFIRGWGGGGGGGGSVAIGWFIMAPSFDPRSALRCTIARGTVGEMEHGSGYHTTSNARVA